MGKGRRPEPTELKRLRGNPGKRRLNDSEPKSPSSLGPAPKWMSAEAKDRWKLVGQQLLNVGVLTELDHTLLEVLCVTYSQWRNGDKGAARELRMQLVEFGMTPSSRSKLVVSSDKQEQDEFEQFLKVHA
jgi:phage terminase small subunit